MPAISHLDVVDFDDGVSANADVVANTAARHTRLHSITSTSDHSDMNSTAPTNGQVLAYWTSGAQWQASGIVADGGTW